MLSSTTSCPGRSRAAMASGRVDDVAEVGIARIGQRRRHADDHDIRLIQPLKVDRRLEAFLAHLPDHRVGDVPDVAFSALEPGDLDRVDVEPQYRDPLLAESPGQRQADVAQADDPDADGRRFDLAQQCATIAESRPSPLSLPPTAASGSWRRHLVTWSFPWSSRMLGPFRIDRRPRNDGTN